jgi:hypothetical protein
MECADDSTREVEQLGCYFSISRLQTEWTDSDISFPLLMAARTHLRSAVQIRRFGSRFVPASEWDRMVHNAYRIELKGDSQRKKRPLGRPSPPQLDRRRQYEDYPRRPR